MRYEDKMMKDLVRKQQYITITLNINMNITISITTTIN